MDARVIVGFDNSAAASSAAVLLAAHEAVLRDEVLQIVSCHEPEAWSTEEARCSPEASHLMKEAERSALETVSQEIRDGFGDLKVDAVFSLERACDALTADVDAHDLVVIGMGRRYGISPYHFARTAAAVVRGKRCPVAVVPVTAEPEIRRVVVGVDGSDRSSAAVRWAAGEAAWHGVSLAIIHAWEDRGWPDRGSREDDRCHAEDEGRRILDVAAELAAEHTDGAVDRVLVEDAPAAAVLRACVDGDLVVLGARETDQATYDVLGSTVTDVLRDVAVPVVIVPARPLAGSN